MDSFYPLIPAAWGFVDETSGLREEFYGLPEETQRALLREDVHTTADLRRRIEELEMKE